MIYETIILDKTENIGLIAIIRLDAMNNETSLFFSEILDAINATADDPKIRVAFF